MIKQMGLSAMLMVLLAACGGGDGESIGKVNTNFKWTGSDRIETLAFDDKDVKGVSCFLSYAKTGGLGETVNLEEDTSDASIACVNSAPVLKFLEKTVAKPVMVFKRDANLTVKTLNVMRYFDPKRKAFIYVVYSDRILSGSPKNATAAISCIQGGKDVCDTSGNTPTASAPQ